MDTYDGGFDPYENNGSDYDDGITEEDLFPVLSIEEEHECYRECERAAFYDPNARCICDDIMSRKISRYAGREG